jgi:hypothetical protein
MQRLENLSSTPGGPKAAFQVRNTAGAGRLWSLYNAHLPDELYRRQRWPVNELFLNGIFPKIFV